MDFEASRQRSLGTVRRTIATVKRVIGMNRDLARKHPSHAESAEARIFEGEMELATLADEEHQLER